MSAVFLCKPIQSVIRSLYIFTDMYNFEDFWLIYCDLVLINKNISIFEGATSVTICLLGVVGNSVSFLK